MSVEIDIAIEAEDWAAVADLEALVQRAVDAAIEASAPGTEAELSVLFCDDATIRTLNRTWRGKDAATNVLSFPAAASPHPGAPALLGDIAVAWGTVAREAEAEGKSLADHLTHLLVHGTLHLVGHDHEGADEAEAMEARERAILASLGIADPYAGSDLAEAHP